MFKLYKCGLGYFIRTQLRYGIKKWSMNCLNKNEAIDSFSKYSPTVLKGYGTYRVKLAMKEYFRLSSKILKFDVMYNKRSGGFRHIIT